MLNLQTNEKLVEHLWAPNLHFLSTEQIDKIATLKNSGTVTIFRNGTVHFDSHIRLTVGMRMMVTLMFLRKFLSGTCFMSFKNYPLDDQLCRVLSVSHSNSIHEVTVN